ncbi:protein kinase, ATP binding site-containing protein, partial [Tanacetum coccineum]
MQEIFGSVRRSLVFRNPDNGDPGSTLVDKIIRKSRVFTRPVVNNNKQNVIRWRKGELIGCGAFGHVYMGMNLDTGELLAVKQVSIAAANTASKEKAQVHIRELEEEVKLLKNLSHSNIVRYLGTVREEETLNILLEFVPGGSISSLLGKFGPFPEAVIRMYTKQILLGLDYLHKNGIMHRDIKGANILVDNKGCIKLADFGASKQVVELANGSGAKSMKGTPYWMAPEVILQTGHS